MWLSDAMSSSVKFPSCAIFFASWLKPRSVYGAMRSNIPATMHPEMSSSFKDVNCVIFPVVERKSEKSEQWFMDLIVCRNCPKLDHSWEGWDRRVVIVCASSASTTTNGSLSLTVFFGGCCADHSFDLKSLDGVGLSGGLLQMMFSNLLNDVIEGNSLASR
jgi:hypothetical protein